MKLLIIEDEKTAGAYLKKGLEENGYTVDVFTDGRDGLQEALSGAYDLLILDVMLPNLDGFSILKALRAAQQNLPVIFLTAREKVSDRVQGLELGADDYLVKPFAFIELLARVRSLLRRNAPLNSLEEAHLLKIADLEIDLLKRLVTRSGVRIALTAKEFALVELFVRKKGEVLSRSLIASHIWDMNFDSDTNVVDVAVRRLRAKIDDDFSPKLIKTVRSVGYVCEDF